MHQVLNSRFLGMVRKTSHMSFVIKAIFPQINYGSEPSVAMGICVPTSFVPPIHTPSASQAHIQGYALRGKLLPATALVCCWFITDRVSSDGSDKPVDASPSDSALPVGADAVDPTPSFSGSFSRTLPGLPPSRSPARSWSM